MTTTLAQAPAQSTETGGGVGVSCRGLVYIYRLEGYDVVALAGVDLDISPGESVALLGPSGSGKSTLLAVLAGLLAPSAGRLIVGDRDMTRATDTELAQMRASHVGVVLQGTNRNLLPYLSAEQNVRFAQRGAAGRRDVRLPGVREVLSLVGLSGRGRGKMRPHQLTPGERQRLALAVALSNGPGLLLADEPTSQLDSRARDEVIAALESVRQAGTTVVLVTHDPTVGMQMGRTITIRDGRVGAEGRRGEDYAVVGRDGSIHLPPEVLQVFAPGSLVEVLLDADGTARLVTAGDPAAATHRRTAAGTGMGTGTTAAKPAAKPASQAKPPVQSRPVAQPTSAQPISAQSTSGTRPTSVTPTSVAPASAAPASVARSKPSVQPAPQPVAKSGFFDTGYVEPYVEPQYVEAQYVEPQYVESQYVEAQYGDPHYVDAQYAEQPYGAYPGASYPEYAEPDPAGQSTTETPDGPTGHSGQSRSGLAERLRKDHGSTEGFDYWGER